MLYLTAGIVDSYEDPDIEAEASILKVEFLLPKSGLNVFLNRIFL